VFLPQENGTLISAAVPHLGDVPPHYFSGYKEFIPGNIPIQTLGPAEILFWRASGRHDYPVKKTVIPVEYSYRRVDEFLPVQGRRIDLSPLPGAGLAALDIK
jgi:hypothetical protein